MIRIVNLKKIVGQSSFVINRVKPTLRFTALEKELRYNHQCVEAQWKQAAVKSVNAGGTKESEPRERIEEDEKPETDHVVLGEPLTVNTELTLNQNTEEQIASNSFDLLEISNEFDIDSIEISPFLESSQKMECQAQNPGNFSNITSKNFLTEKEPGAGLFGMANSNHLQPSNQPCLMTNLELTNDVATKRDHSRQ